MPAKISFLRPVASIARATRASSNALTEERSMIGTPGSASTSSGNVGPHMLSRAVVVTMMGNFRALAAWASATKSARDHRDELAPYVRIAPKADANSGNYILDNGTSMSHTV